MPGKSCCGGACSAQGKENTGCTQNDLRQDCNNQEGPNGGCGCAGSGTIEKYITGYASTSAGAVPRVSTKLSFSDKLGEWKARWSAFRMDYSVEPGLYCTGDPNGQSPVLVTANYKMTFDKLRRELGGLDAWIMVLDTKGINVWCAAGEGTFGTAEVVNRIARTKLGSIVEHRTLILPQLGASGVAAHDVMKQSGFKVVYGPVRACDIKEFLASGMKATQDMRTVRFTFADRIALIPIEITGSIKPTVIVFGILFILNAIGLGHYGWVDMYAFLGAIAAGCVITPALLPWLPGRAFSLKGLLPGLLWAAAVNIINGFPAEPGYGWLKAAAFMLVLPSLSSFAALNFTGSSTYTSLSGVDREMKFTIPAMLVSTIIGVILLLVNDFILALA